MSLDSYLPNYCVRETHHFAVRTSPAETFRAFCNFNMGEIPWIRRLFRFRTIFNPDGEAFSKFGLRNAYSKGDGFVLLQELHDRELTVGAIGKFWRPVISYRNLHPDDFAAFREAGFGKVAWTLRCEPRFGGGTLGTFEVRVGATDTRSTAKMKIYYSLIGPFSRAIRSAVLKRMSVQLGDLFDERSRPLPGDAIIEEPVGAITRGITIDAPVVAIWPWLVQMGCLRAGWYSYDWLDNAGIPSATRIIEKWQDLKQGDFVPVTPQADAGFYVVSMEPQRSLVLGGCYDLSTQESIPIDSILPEKYWRTTWTFVLEPQTELVTRLIVRARADFYPPHDLKSGIRKTVLSHVNNLMERRQLQNLKKRAESEAAFALSPS